MFNVTVVVLSLNIVTVSQWPASRAAVASRSLSISAGAVRPRDHVSSTISPSHRRLCRDPHGPIHTARTIRPGPHGPDRAARATRPLRYSLATTR